LEIRSGAVGVGKGMPMGFIIIAPGINTEAWCRHLLAADPGLDLRVWPDSGDPATVSFALVWQAPPGELQRYPHLRCIASLGAGADHILSDPQLPAGVPVTRVVHDSLSRGMSEYVLATVLSQCRHLWRFQQDQRRARWRRRLPMETAKTCIGIMGLGQLGADAARRLGQHGFPVVGWSRTPKKIEGVAAYAGDNQLRPFLARSQVLVCMLPLTPATRDILNAAAFAALPRGAYLINVARGEHLVEDDLFEALTDDQLSGACLDVFREEPLPESHPFWHHPRITVTPHVASITHPGLVAPQIVANYRRVQNGKPPRNQVDRQRGY
jgi:glyoxylate/hydroxypyruvate reductase A